MKFSSTIKVGNDSELGVDRILAETSCVGFITLKIPAQVKGNDIELKRKDLIEFLLRTQPQLAFTVGVNALKD